MVWSAGRPLSWQWKHSEVFLSHSFTVYDNRANTLMLSNSGKTLLILCYERIVKALLKGNTQSQHSQQLETGSFYGTEYRINNTVFTAVGWRRVVFFLSLEHAVMSSYTVSFYRKQGPKLNYRNKLGFLHLCLPLVALQHFSFLTLLLCWELKCHQQLPGKRKNISLSL